jgi:hypothetical protein
MEKKIDDYLYLYPNSNAWLVINDSDTAYGGVVKELLNTHNNSSIKRIIPHIRPLSDLTKEEAKEWFDLFADKRHGQEFGELEWVTSMNGKECDPHWTIWEKSTKGNKTRCGICVDLDGGLSCRWSPEMFHWFIKNQFDILGLIETGLALDKTKL